MKLPFDEAAGCALRLAETLFALPVDHLPVIGFEPIGDPAEAMEELFARCLGRLADPGAAPTSAPAVPTAFLEGASASGAAIFRTAPGGQAAAGRPARVPGNSREDARADADVPPTRQRLAQHSSEPPARSTSAAPAGPRPSALAGSATLPAGQGPTLPAASLPMPATSLLGQRADHMPRPLQAAHPISAAGRRAANGASEPPRSRGLTEHQPSPTHGDAEQRVEPPAPVSLARRAPPLAEPPPLSAAAPGHRAPLADIAARLPRASTVLPDSPRSLARPTPDGDPPGERPTRLLSGVSDLNHLFAALPPFAPAPGAALPPAGDLPAADGRAGAERRPALGRCGEAAPGDPLHAAPGAAVIDAVAEELLCERLLMLCEDRLREQAMRHFGFTGGLI
ncbi:hypothetical protein [Accumulibacter sp.]|uniref:hypothetical protein n=5 Tax=Accumulibacter sp. TaxID=2053492 RepID=UPI002C986ED9|nr:hypothetical protein [Accumulibacter sp.]HNE39540.1 hypothetical protein [Accumulibacter sp.]HNG14952.1 hypothetical protein [Accumulibacter sp.]